MHNLWVCVFVCVRDIVAVCYVCCCLCLCLCANNNFNLFAANKRELRLWQINIAHTPRCCQAAFPQCVWKVIKLTHMHINIQTSSARNDAAQAKCASIEWRTLLTSPFFILFWFMPFTIADRPYAHGFYVCGSVGVCVCVLPPPCHCKHNVIMTVTAAIHLERAATATAAPQLSPQICLPSSPVFASLIINLLTNCKQ